MHSTHLVLVRCMLALFIMTGLVSVDATAQKKPGASPASSSPASPATPSASGASASNAPVEVEWLAYGALDEVLQKVADYSCGDKPGLVSKVLILDPPTLQALQAYDSFYQQAESLSAAFLAMAPVSGAGGTIDTFADITGAVTAAAVATNSETSYMFTIQDPTAAIVLLGKLRRESPESCKSAHYAGVYTVSDISAASKSTAETVEEKPTQFTKELPSVPKELKDLALTRSKVLQRIIGEARSEPQTCKASPAPISGSTPTLTAINSQDPCVSAFNNLDGTYNSFLTALSTPSSTTGQPAVSAAEQGYPLRALLQTATETAPVLGIYLSIAAAGGTQQDRKNLLTAIFTGDWIRYSGGVSVNVIIFKFAGKDSINSKILFSDLVRYRTPLRHIKKPSAAKKTLNAGDNLDVFP